jgi:TonB family protein
MAEGQKPKATRRGRRASRRNVAGLLITVALHGGILLAVAAAHSKQEAPLIVPHDYVVAEMVKLGKPREKFWLPRIVQPPPPKAPDAIKLADDPNAKPVPKEAPREDDPKLNKDLKRALDRARKLEALAAAEQQEDEGLATGSRLGTSNQAVGDQYLAQVKGLLLQNYALPAGIAAEEIHKPPKIRITIGADGRLSGIKLLDSSGNSFVDDACVNAAQLTRQVPPPPAQFSNRGIGVECEK